MFRHVALSTFGARIDSGARVVSAKVWVRSSENHSDPVAGRAAKATNRLVSKSMKYPPTTTALFEAGEWDSLHRVERSLQRQRRHGRRRLDLCGPLASLHADVIENVSVDDLLVEHLQGGASRRLAHQLGA